MDCVLGVLLPTYILFQPFGLNLLEHWCKMLIPLSLSSIFTYCLITSTCIKVSHFWQGFTLYRTCKQTFSEPYMYPVSEAGYIRSPIGLRSSREWVVVPKQSPSRIGYSQQQQTDKDLLPGKWCGVTQLILFLLTCYCVHQHFGLHLAANISTS